MRDLETTFKCNQNIKDLFLHLGAAEESSTLVLAALTLSKQNVRELPFAL
jgi:hypothetical protein